MFCPFCGTNNPDNAAFCSSCGNSMNVAQRTQEHSSAPAQPQPAAPKAENPQTQPKSSAPQTSPSAPIIPPQYKPLSAWAYVGYSLLFAIPIVGFILQIVFAFSKKNLNRRAYARSYFCAYLLAAIIGLLVLLVYFILLIVGAGGMMLM